MLSVLVTYLHRGATSAREPEASSLAHVVSGYLKNAGFTCYLPE